MCRYIMVRYWGIRLQRGSCAPLTVVGERIAEHAEDLAVFADYLGVKSLECFLGQSSGSRKGARQGRPGPEPRWHSAAEGLRTVQSLLSYLSWYPRSDRYYKEVRTELATFERALERAERRGVRWRLVAWSERRYFCRGGATLVPLSRLRWWRPHHGRRYSSGAAGLGRREPPNEALQM